jgi:hypothetical protein
MSADWFFFSFVLLYLIHMHEEYWTGFARMFTPPRLTGALADRGFWVLNPLLLGLGAAIGTANLMGAPWAFFWAALMASVFFWNAFVHGIWSVFSRSYRPGLITGLLYIPLFIIWTVMLAGGGNINWDTYWTALLTGLAIMVVVPGIAILGHKVLR